MRKLLVLPLLLLSLSSSAQNFEWAIRMSGLNLDRLGKSTIDNSGNTYTTGAMNGTLYITTPNITGSSILQGTGNNQRDIFITKQSSSGNLIWKKCVGGINHDEAESITVDQFGNIYITGFFQGIVDFDPSNQIHNLISNGDEDCFILKLDSNGIFVWAKNIGSFGDDTGIDIEAYNNDLYVVGEFYLQVDFDPNAGFYELPSNGGRDIFLVKLDLSGNLIWAKTFGSDSSSESVDDMDVDQFGDVVTTGIFSDTMDVDPNAGVVELNSPNNNVFIQKISNSGTFLWASSFGDSLTSDLGTTVEFDKSNNVIFSGIFSGSMDCNPDSTINNSITSLGGWDAFLIKLNPNGGLNWGKSLGGPQTQQIFSITVDENNQIYLTGNTEDSVDFDFGLSEQMYYSADDQTFILTVDSSGNYINKITFSDANSSFGRCISVDNNDNIYLSGIYYGTIDINPFIDTSTLISLGSADIFLMKINHDSCFYFNIKIDSLLNVNCNQSGYISISSSGGINPYSYLWNSNPLLYDSSLVISNYGINSILVTDSLGCIREKSILIDEPSFSNNFDLASYLHTNSIRPTFTSYIWIDGFNDGCIPVSGTISCILDTILNFNFSIPPPDSISGDTLVWNFTNLTYDSLHITPVINISNTGQNGDTVELKLMINPIMNDVDSSNNYKTYHFPVSNLYEANFKQVYPQGECLPNYVLNGKPLTYTIRFQHLGNGIISNLYILDTLDLNLDLGSLNIIGSSHDLIPEILPGNVIKFRFDDINLPNINTDNLLSHGYVIYEIKPLVGTPDNTLVENKSRIYMDFEQPTTTNTTENTLLSFVPNTFSNTESISLCYNSDYTFPDGTVYSNIILPISHQSNLWMVDGCDSIITTNISVLNPIDTGVGASISTFAIEANASGMTYQWYDCSTDLPLLDETYQILNPIFPGIFYVVISDGNCSDTSACYAAGTIGINENQISGLNIYPNPAKNVLTIQQESYSKLTIEILNIEGRLIQSFTSSEKNIQTDVSEFAIGMYFINVKSENGNAVYKLVKE